MNKRAMRCFVAADLALLIALVLWRPWGPIGMLIAGTTLFTLAMVGVLGSVTVDRAPATDSDPTRRRWDRAVEHHQGVLSAYGAYELDPSMFLRYPAMWDLTAPAIVDFHDALELVGGLATDSYPDPKRAREYVDAVAMLRTDWAKADRHARSTGTSHLAASDAQAFDRAEKLLNHAEGTTGPERAAYLEQVLETVDSLGERGVVTPPRRLHAELAAKVRRAIEK